MEFIKVLYLLQCSAASRNKKENQAKKKEEGEMRGNLSKARDASK